MQFAGGKSISEQLPLYESIVNEYERISGHDYADDAKVPSILQAVPAHLRAHLQLWITDSTTHEQLKNKVMELEALATRWDSSNSLSLPTRLGMDEAVPMEVFVVTKARRAAKANQRTKGSSKERRKEKGSQKARAHGKVATKGRMYGRKEDLARKERVKRREKQERPLVPATIAGSLDTMQRSAGAAREWHQLRRRVEEHPRQQVDKDRLQ